MMCINQYLYIDIFMYVCIQDKHIFNRSIAKDQAESDPAAADQVFTFLVSFVANYNQLTATQRMDQVPSRSSIQGVHGAGFRSLIARFPGDSESNLGIILGMRGIHQVLEA